MLEELATAPNMELTLITPPEWRSDDGRTLPFVPVYTRGYQVRQAPVVFNGRYHFYMYRGLSAMVRELAPDIVHIDEEPYNPAGAQAQRAAGLAGAQSIFVVLQNLYKEFPFPFAAMERYNYQRTAHVIAVNAAAGEVLRRKGYRGPLSAFTVYGIDPNLYQPAPRQEQRPPDSVLIGYLGRLTLYKGTGLLIEALANLPPRFRLRFIGSGPDEPVLRQMVDERGMRARVDFHAAVPTTGVPAALAEVDMLAVPSMTQPNWMEQFGRVLIEAMACGVPVIGSDSGEIPHVIGDAGIIVPEGDAGSLRAAIQSLGDNPQARAQYANAGRKRALTRFTNLAAAQNIYRVYQSVLAARAQQES
jgi:glycosyltransferase involved in cell wall biosynthesis